MRSIIVAAIAALAFASAANAVPGPAQGPYHLDSHGRCRAAGGQHVLARLCAVPPPKHCRDSETHRVVKCGTPGAIPT